MELNTQEAAVLSQFVERMDETVVAIDAGKQDDQVLLKVYQEFINDKKNISMIDTLTKLATYFVENNDLLILITTDKKVSDKTVEHLFFDTIDEVEVDQRKKILLLLSTHRYLLFELIVNKVSILEQLASYIDELTIDPGLA